jgi:hypothetical protein
MAKPPISDRPLSLLYSYIYCIEAASFRSLPWFCKTFPSRIHRGAAGGGDGSTIPSTPQTPQVMTPRGDFPNHDHTVSHVHDWRATSIASDAIDAKWELRSLLTSLPKSGKSFPLHHRKRATPHPAPPSLPPASQTRLARLD